MKIQNSVLVCFGICLILMAVGTAASVSAPPTEEWNKTFGGASFDEYAISGQQTVDGGFILAGFTYSYDVGGGDAWLIKTDSEGNEEWNNTFGGIKQDWGHSVQQTSDGGFILAGFTDSYGTGGIGDALLVKTDSKGNEEWIKNFGGTSSESAYSVQQTSDGGFILTGFTDSYGAGMDDAWLVKTDSEGNEVWNNTFGGANYDGASSVQQTADGGFILAGSTRSYGVSRTDAWLIKTDSEGNEEWNNTFGGAFYDDQDYAFSVQQTADGGFIMGGRTQSYDVGGGDAWLIKTDSEGNEEWNNTFGGTSYDNAHSVQQTADGGFIMGGLTYSYDVGGGDAWLIKTDSEGNEEWSNTFGGTSSDYGNYAQQTADGGFMLAGMTYSYGAGESDVWLVKIGPAPLEFQNINIKPDEINTKKKAKFINAYIEPPELYSVEDIDMDSIALIKVNDNLLETPLYSVGPSKIRDYDKDGIPGLKVRFDVQGLVFSEGGNVCTIAGKLNDGQEFIGTDTITVATKGEKQK